MSERRLLAESLAQRALGSPLIVVIEDNLGDAYLIQLVLKRHQVCCDLKLIRDGEAAIDFFDSIDDGREPARPCLVLLDLNLPRFSGHEVLARIRQSYNCHNTPVIVVSSSESPSDLAENARLGATAFFRKPPNLEDFLRLGGIVKPYLTSEPTPGTAHTAADSPCPPAPTIPSP